MRRVRVIVTGRVQGVSFHASTVAEARRLGLIGWVRNLSDGSVELEAQGAHDAVCELLAWCEHGPPVARVTKVAVDDVPAVAGESTFAIGR